MRYSLNYNFKVLLALGLAACVLQAHADTGSVQTIHGHATQLRDQARSALEINENIRSGDVLQTQGMSTVQMRLTRNGHIHMTPNTSLIVQDYQVPSSDSPGTLALILQQGGLCIDTGRLAQQAPEGQRLQTPMALLSTHHAHYAAMMSSGALAVHVFKGNVSVTNDFGRELSVSAGQDALIKQNHAPKLVSRAQRADWNSFCEYKPNALASGNAVGADNAASMSTIATVGAVAGGAAIVGIIIAASGGDDGGAGGTSAAPGTQ